MHRTIRLLLLSIPLLLPSAYAQDEIGDPAMNGSMSPLMGGCGGVYFLAEPGELVVEVEKRDRNARDTTAELRGILVGPDREVLDEGFIPDDGLPRGGGLGPAGRLRLAARVPARGVYALNITVSQDRYGQNMLWCFRTNCPRYVIETARGHKDERHQEPIVLEGPEGPAEVWFQPRPAPIAIEASGVPKGSADLQLLNAAGDTIASLAVDAEGKASATVPAGERGPAELWCLRLPEGRGVLNVDGLTRWEKTDPHPDKCVWSPDAEVWFPLSDNRWLLTPYSRIVYSGSGSEGQVTLNVRNSAPRKRAVSLSLEFPEESWPVSLSTERVELEANRDQAVTVRCALPPEIPMRRCRVRATAEDGGGFSTYSTIELRAGDAPAMGLLDMPLRLTPYNHENRQLGHIADFPTESQMYFGTANEPYVRAGSGLWALRDGRWELTDLRSAVTSRPPSPAEATFSQMTTKIAFDGDGDIYLLSGAGSTGVLLHSADGGKTFSAYEVPGRSGAWDIEQFSGHNAPDGPPAIVRFTRTAKDPKLRWRALHDLELIVPRKVDGHLEMGEIVPISDKAIGFSGHSGMPSSVVSRGSKVHVTWGEATDPEEKVPGVPTYVVTYDRETGQLGEPALVGYGPPANDVHNTPSITMDGEGYLHVLVGTHGRPFQYAKSLAANDAGGGWTEPVSAGEGLSQTYIGYVCGGDGTLHTVFRLWRSGEPYPHSSHATLAYQRKRPGRPWEEPRILIVAPFSEYSVFYHRLTIDRAGRLFLSYDYWSTHWFYRNDHYGSRRNVMMSPDGGDSWKLLLTADL